MSTENEQETPKAEVPNSHLADVHSQDNKDVVKEKSEAEAEEREANKIEPGVNTHLADVHAGKVNESGENIETVTVPEDVERNGGPSSEPIAEKTETMTGGDLPSHVGGIKLEHEIGDAEPSKDEAAQ